MPTKITLNQDPDFVAEMKRQFQANGGYCPCALYIKTKS